MVSCTGTGDRGNPCAWQANSDLGTADHGVELGKAISELSPGTEPSQMVEPADQLYAAGNVGQHLCAKRTNPSGIG